MRNFLSISCAFSAAYRARTGPHHTVRIPQYMVRKFRRQWCGNSARSVHFRSISCDFRRSFCASARSCAEIPHGPIRKLASICKFQVIRTNGFQVIAVGCWDKKNQQFVFDSLCGFVRYLSYPESCGWVKWVCGRAGQVNKGTP